MRCSSLKLEPGSSQPSTDPAAASVVKHALVALTTGGSPPPPPLPVGKLEPFTAAGDSRDLEDCVICLDEKRDRTIVLPCMHEYCFDCIHKWLGINPECPLCKQAAASLVHDIQSDGEFKEDKVDVPPARHEFPGVVYWHRFQPQYNARVSLPNCTRDIVSRLFAEGSHPPTDVMRAMLYMLDLQTRFHVPQQRIRDHSPAFLSRNHPAISRLTGFLTRDLAALRIPLISTIQRTFMTTLFQCPINSVEMLQSLTTRASIADYASRLQTELQQFAGYTSTQEDYDRSVDYITRLGHVVYNQEHGIVGQELTQCIVEALIFWTGGSNRSPHMEMNLITGLYSIMSELTANPNNEQYSSLMNLLCRARQHYNARARPSAPVVTSFARDHSYLSTHTHAHTNYNSTSPPHNLVYQPSSSNTSSFISHPFNRTGNQPLACPRFTTIPFQRISSGQFVQTQHLSPSNVEDDWSFLNSPSTLVTLNTPRVAPSPSPPPEEHISPSVYSYISASSIPSPVLSPRTISSATTPNPVNDMSDCVIVEHSRTRDAIVISSDSSESDSSLDMSPRPLPPLQQTSSSSRKRPDTPRYNNSSDSDQDPADARLPPKKRRFHFRVRSPSLSSESSYAASSSERKARLRSSIGLVVGSPLHLSSPPVVTSESDASVRQGGFGKLGVHMISDDSSHEGGGRPASVVVDKLSSSTATTAKTTRRKKLRALPTVSSSSGSLDCPILISDDEGSADREEDRVEAVVPPETSGSPPSPPVNPQLMNIYQPSTVDDFYRYLTSDLVNSSIADDVVDINDISPTLV